MKSIALYKLQEIARKMCFEALGAYLIPAEYRKTIYLEIGFEGDCRIFELCVPGEGPKDAKVISRARIDSRTGKGSVEVIGLTPKPTSPSTPDSPPSTPRG